jgi:hypothetical protein
MEHRAGEPYFVENESNEEEPEGRGLLTWILIVGLLIATGSGSAFAWRAFGGGQAISGYRPPADLVTPAPKSAEPADIAALKKADRGCRSID